GVRPARRGGLVPVGTESAPRAGGLESAGRELSADDRAIAAEGSESPARSPKPSGCLLDLPGTPYPARVGPRALRDARCCTCRATAARPRPFVFRVDEAAGRGVRPVETFSGFPVIRRSVIMEKRRFRIVKLEERI